MKIKNVFPKRISDDELSSIQIIGEIRKINNELEQAYESFQNQTDDDLLEASIYRIKELRSRHNYLMKLARENKTEAFYMKFPEAERVKNA